MGDTPNDHVLVLIGPSGAGKSAVARSLHRQGVVRITPTWTTRPRRADEARECPEHRFVSAARFDRLAGAGWFRATGRLPGLPHRYGLPWTDATDDRLPLLVGRAGFVDVLAGDARPLVYLLAAGVDTVARRLGPRGLDRCESSARLAAAALELDAGRSLCDREFDAARPLPEVVSAVAEALAADALPADLARLRSSIGVRA